MHARDSGSHIRKVCGFFSLKRDTKCWIIAATGASMHMMFAEATGRRRCAGKGRLLIRGRPESRTDCMNAGSESIGKGRKVEFSMRCGAACSDRIPKFSSGTSGAIMTGDLIAGSVAEYASSDV